MTLKGIDIASYQAGMNTKSIEADFVIVKATEGIGYVNPVFKEQIDGAITGGKKVGIYHFADGKTSGREEANYFLSKIKNYIGKAVLVLDWEADALKKGVNYAKEFLDTVKSATGVNAMIYMSKSVAHGSDWSSVAKEHALWVAQYASMNQTGYQSEPWTDDKGYGAFGSPAIFQYSSRGRLNGWGGNLDLNIAYLSSDSWDKFARANGSSVSNPNAPQHTSRKRIDEDGIPGYETVGLAQEIAGTKIDHRISNQYHPNDKYRPALVAASDYTNNKKLLELGSALWREVQKSLGTDIDGIHGKNDTHAAQVKWGLKIDDIWGHDTTVEWQKRLNSGKLS